MKVISLYDLNRDQYLSFPTSCTIGRKGADVNFPYDAKLSRIHCQFLAKDGVFYIQDLGSTNQIMISNEKYNSHQVAKVKKGQIIQFGRQRLKFISIKVGKPNVVENFPIAPFEEQENRNDEEAKTQLKLSFNPKKARSGEILEAAYNNATTLVTRTATLGDDDFYESTWDQNIKEDQENFYNSTERREIREKKNNFRKKKVQKIKNKLREEANESKRSSPKYIAVIFIFIIVGATYIFKPDLFKSFLSLF